MPGGSRALPARPNLRFLKLEAKRRLAAGEFATLNDAQTAIAREHGQPSWASLKQLIEKGHALAQLRWVISRFSGADQPGWPPPGEDELRQHFSEAFLAALPPANLITVIAPLAAELRGDLTVIGQAPFEALVELAGVQYIATVETEPPHRLTGLRGLATGQRLRDPRTATAAPVRTHGPVPTGIPEIADQAFEELGLPALLLAGGKDADTDEPWVLAKGWADLDRDEPLDPGHRFPAPGVTALVTTTAVLRLVADGRVGLDDRANGHLTMVKLADDTITVRELLSHTAGVDDPTQMYAHAVPELATLMGPVIGCAGPRGVVKPSNGGIAVLGQLVADVTQTPFAQAATRMVLAPLGLRDSSFPARPGLEGGPGAVTSYNLTLQGMFEPIPARVSTLQAVAGLWSTGADLVRLGLRWSSLLPGSLAHEALTPQTASGQRPAAGLGWLISPDGDIAAHAGGGLEATASLTIRIRDNRTHVILTSRFIPISALDAQLISAWTNPT